MDGQGLDLGQVAYEAYMATYDYDPGGGATFKAWEGLAAQEQERWRAIADGVKMFLEMRAQQPSPTRASRVARTAEHVFSDPVGNELVVEPLTGHTAVIRLVQQEGEKPCVIITPDEAQAVADAVRASTRG